MSKLQALSSKGGEGESSACGSAKTRPGLGGSGRTIPPQLDLGLRMAEASRAVINNYCIIEL